MTTCADSIRQSCGVCVGSHIAESPVVDRSPGLVFHRDVRCSCFSTASAAKTPPSNGDVPGSGTTITAALLLSGAKSSDYRVDQQQL